MQQDALVEKLMTVRSDLAVEGVTHMALFGSRARGDHSEKSDLDLLLDVDPASRFSILNLVGVEHIVEKATGLRANAFMRRSLDDGFRNSIKNDLIEVF
jgi:predicted nucleotidyltransferase